MESNKQNLASYEEILKQASQTGTSTRKFSKTYPAYIVLVIFIGLSFLVKDSFKTKVENETKASFSKAVNSIMMRAESKYRSNLQVLTSIQGLYEKYIDVVRDYFKLYSSVPTSTDKSIKSLMFVPEISSNQVDDHVFNMQRQGLWEYKIHPPSTKESYMPVEFIEPSAENELNFGFDFTSNEEVVNAINKARDNNIVTATEVMQTLSNKNSDGFYLIAPVYKYETTNDDIDARKRNFKGVVVQEVSVDEFFKGALGGNFPSDTTIIFEFYEINGAKESRIFASKNIDLLKNDYSPITTKEVINLADKKIEIRFYTIPTFVDWFSRYLDIISFAVSLLLSFVFFGFILSVTTSRARALDLAERMTRSQRRIVDSSKDIIAVLDLQGIWRTMNPAAYDIFGTEAQSLIGGSIKELFEEDSEYTSLMNLVAASNEEITHRIDYRMKSADSGIKWINWSFTISKADGLIYAIGRDVTLEKIAEEEAKLRSKQMQLAEQFTREASEFKSYFMTKLSHQMRNSLTGIIGYLQLVSAKVYESEEELDSYISLAEESSEELFTFVSDMVEVALGNTDSSLNSLVTINLDTVLKDAVAKMVDSLPEDKNISASLMDEEIVPKVVADKRLLLSAFMEIMKSLSEGIDKTELTIAATENPYEGATEVQIMTNANPLVTDMIQIYKDNTNNIIEHLSKDKNDILLHFAIGASIIRMMNGTMTVETFGAEEGNIIQITLPLNKKSA